MQLLVPLEPSLVSLHEQSADTETKAASNSASTGGESCTNATDVTKILCTFFTRLAHCKKYFSYFHIKNEFNAINKILVHYENICVPPCHTFKILKYLSSYLQAECNVYCDRTIHKSNSNKYSIITKQHVHVKTTQ